MIMLDAVTIAREVNAGRLDPVAVTEAFGAVIATRNGQLNAVIGFDIEKVMSDARALAKRIEAGASLPLAGVPVVVKDNIYVAGQTISQGSRHFADFRPAEDAIAVERLRDAGAIIIGIGNCPEFACKGQTNSPHNGIARNPWNTTLTPGGSSGGNASALAADFAPIALGTDAGGSGRRPAAHTGTVGFKPSLGAIPYGPGFPEPFFNISVIAPMGRTVSDVIAVFEAVAGASARDPDSIVINANTGTFDPTHLRFAFSSKLGLDVPVDADVSDAVDAGIEQLRRAGWPIAPSDPSWPIGLSETALMPLQTAGLAALYGAAFMQERERALFDPDVAAQIEAGLTVTGSDVAAALEASRLIKLSASAFFGQYDLLICPTTPCVAWSVDRLGPSHIGGIAVPPRGHAVFTPFFNHALTPAISIPCGYGRNGLPVGLQIIGRRGADWLVLQAARVAEAALASINARSMGLA